MERRVPELLDPAIPEAGLSLEFVITILPLAESASGWGFLSLVLPNTAQSTVSRLDCPPLQLSHRDLHD